MSVYNGPSQRTRFALGLDQTRNAFRFTDAATIAHCQTDLEAQPERRISATSRAFVEQLAAGWGRDSTAEDACPCGRYRVSGCDCEQANSSRLQRSDALSLKMAELSSVEVAPGLFASRNSTPEERRAFVQRVERRRARARRGDRPGHVLDEMSVDLRRRAEQEAAAARQRAQELIRDAEQAEAEAAAREEASQRTVASLQAQRAIGERAALNEMAEMERQLGAIAVEDEELPEQELQAHSRDWLQNGKELSLYFVIGNDVAAGTAHAFVVRCWGLYNRLVDQEPHPDVVNRVRRLERKAWATFVRRVRWLAGED